MEFSAVSWQSGIGEMFIRGGRAMVEDRRAKIDRIRAVATATLGRLRNLPVVDLLDAKAQVKGLIDARQFDLAISLAEAVSRRDPGDPTNRRRYAQVQIETHNVTAAIDMLKAIMARLPSSHPEYAEALGLLGRSYKQMFIDAPDKSGKLARSMLRKSLAAYRRPYEADPAKTWHGINLVALLTYARRLGLPIDDGLDPRAIARDIVSRLNALTEKDGDEWHFLTLAEAYLSLGQWDDVDRAIGSYINSSPDKAFVCASALRQFRDVWNVEDMGPRGRSIAAALRAAVLELEGHDLRVDPHEIKALQAFQPEEKTLEAILGDDGPTTYRFMQMGMQRALAVASIRLKLTDRVGTGFLVRASDFGLAPKANDELLVLTNWHVVNPDGLYPGIGPDEAEIVFEAVDSQKTYNVKAIAWSSPVQQVDASFLRLDGSPPSIDPLPLAEKLPVVQDKARVYVIGYPGGHELSLSLQDNRLLDHEGPPAGKPQIPGVWRVHYRAPTEPGSSGSPVFDDRVWSVIALHHAGSEKPIGRLNGKSGTYVANEGIAIRSIRDAIANGAAG